MLQYIQKNKNLDITVAQPGEWTPGQDPPLDSYY